MDEKSRDLETKISIFNELVGKDPLDTTSDERFVNAIMFMRDASMKMAGRSYLETWLIDLFDNNCFVRFFNTYVLLLLRNENQCLHDVTHCIVVNFIRLIMTVWCISHKVQSFSVRLWVENVPYRLFDLIKRAEFSPLKCSTNINTRLIVQSCVGILHNISFHTTAARPLYRSLGMIELLKSYIITSGFPVTSDGHEKQNMNLRTSCLLLLSFLMSESDYVNLHSIDCHIRHLLAVLEDAVTSTGMYSALHGYKATEVLQGLCHLAAPDKNKRCFIRNNALHVIYSILSKLFKIKHSPVGSSDLLHLTDTVAAETLELLWTLTYVPEGMTVLRPGSKFRLLVEKFTMEDHWSKECVFNAQGLLCNFGTAVYIMGSEPKEGFSEAKFKPLKRKPDGHIMISYQHTTQPLMLMVRDELRKHGFSVWMDVDNMNGSFVDCMAHAIQNASGLVLGISQAFKSSPHCRREILYASNLKVPLYPLLLESDFHVDGWLGIMLARIPYISLTNPLMVTSVISELAKRLKSDSEMYCEFNLLDLCEKNKSKELKSVCLSNPVEKWNEEDVLQWSRSIGLSNYETFFSALNGSLLVELISLCKLTSKSLMRLLEIDIQMPLADQQILHNALVELIPFIKIT